MGKPDQELVDAAKEAGVLTNKGPHYYDEDGDHVGQGVSAASEYLRDTGFSPETETQDDETEPKNGDTELQADEDKYDANAYRYTGEGRATFRRERRADGFLYPGGVYRELPTEQEDIQQMIDDGTLVPAA